MQSAHLDNRSQISKSTFGKKLVVVGTIAAMCAISAVLYQKSEEQTGISFFGEDKEVELAFINFLAEH